MSKILNNFSVDPWSNLERGQWGQWRQAPSLGAPTSCDKTVVVLIVAEKIILKKAF